MGFAEFVRQNRYKIFKTYLSYIICISLGGATTLLGSSLLDIQIRVQESFSTTSRLVSIRALGYFIGAVISGPLEKFATDTFILCLSSLIAGISLIVAPWPYQFLYLAVFIFISGLAQGVNDIFASLLVLRTWGKKCTNWMQLYSMSFGIGALLTPVFTRPFLLPLTTDHDGSSTDIQANGTLVYSPEDVRIQYAFLILGGPLAVTAIPLFFCYLRERNQSGEIVGEKSTEIYAENSRLRKYLALLLIAIIGNLNYGAQVLIGTLGPAFAVKAETHMDKQTAALLVTLFWSCFSFYRLLFIPLTMFFKEDKLMRVNLLILVIGVAVLVPHAAYNSIYAWISFLLLGIGCSPLYSCLYGIFLRYSEITGNMASFIIIGGITGESIHPFFLAPYIDGNPTIFVYYLGTLLLTEAILCFLMPLYCRKMLIKAPIPRKKTLSYTCSR